MMGIRRASSWGSILGGWKFRIDAFCAAATNACAVAPLAAHDACADTIDACASDDYYSCNTLLPRTGARHLWVLLVGPADYITNTYIASQMGHLPVVEGLLKSGADTSKATSRGRTPLRIAIALKL